MNNGSQLYNIFAWILVPSKEQKHLDSHPIVNKNETINIDFIDMIQLAQLKKSFKYKKMHK